MRKEKHHEIIFAGQNISEDYLAELLEILDTVNYSIVVISKSGSDHGTCNCIQGP